MALRLDRSSNAPLYHQLKELIKKDILSNQLTVGTQVPSEREMCEIYHVSRITATRATADLVKEGFLQKEPGRGTFVADSSSHSDKTHVLGIGLYEAQYLHIPFFSTIIAGATEAACAAGYHIQLIVTKGVSDKEQGSLYDRMLDQKKVDGLIVIDHAVSDADLIDMHTHGVPVVLFDRTVLGYDFYSVLVDNRGGAFQLVEYLNNLGHKDIGYVTPGFSLPPVRERYEGYRSALQIRGLDFHPEWVIDYKQNIEDGNFEAAIARLMQLKHRPTALIFHEDYAAIKAASLLYKLDYRIPRDISITGFDNIPQSAISLPSLTTVDSRLADMGRFMAKVLLSQIRNEPLPNKCQLAKTKIVVRESTGIAPGTKQSV